MLPSIDNAREGFLCPECHQDMSNMEMLQIHFQTVHIRQSTKTTGKGFFSFAKQKLKNVQDNLKSSAEPSKPYAQYFSFHPNDSYSKQQYMGYTSSHSDLFRRIRQEKHEQIFRRTSQLLLQVELLTKTDEYIPLNRNTKERRKYEQGIIPWMEDSVASICASCWKPFGLSRRKHHCRLHGYVICNQCSQFLSFSNARYIIDPNASLSSTANSAMTQRFTNLTSIISLTADNNGSNEDYLRICLSCGQILQSYYNQIRYKNIPVDEIFHRYEEIVQAQKEYKRIQPTYSTIIDSLLNGDTQYQLADAHRVYRELGVHYEKIDSTSKLIVQSTDNDTTSSSNRYTSLCRNIRTYSIQMLQNFSIATRRIPGEDDIKRARHDKKRVEDERIATLALTIPRFSFNPFEIPEELEPFVQQYYRVTQFLQQAKLAGNQDEVKSLELNLKELEQAISMVKKN